MKVIRLNRFHFGALAGLANCLMHLDRHAQALKAFRRAQRIHPFMEGVASTIRRPSQCLAAGRRWIEAEQVLLTSHKQHASRQCG
jgi:hypothetical protein